MKYTSDYPIKIPLSLVKLFLLLLGCVMIVAISILLILDPNKYILPRFNSPTFVKMVGYVGAGLFGVIGTYVLFKLFDKKPGLMIDEYGITDNSSGTSIGLIEWLDIDDIKTTRIMSNKILVIYTNQPEKYIKKAKNNYTKRALSSNLRSFKSPLSLSANTLKINHTELEQLLKEHLKKNKEEVTGL